ncbi:MAG: hypothetical protein H6607_00895 [Flavobacteriales bacterium]|nr:hypothetical protein [Flavobacteriales bacterium]
MMVRSKLLALLLFCVIVSFTQDLNQSRYESDKLFVSTDRYFFEPGEQLYYTVFVTNEENKVQDQHTMIKVLLQDGQGNTIDSMVSQCTNGRFSQMFNLPQKGGIYYIKALTRWQLNDKKQHLFSKEIFVQNTVKKHFFIAQKLDKNSYSAGDNLESEITMSKSQSEFLDNLPVSATLVVNDVEVEQKSVTTNKSGLAKATFNLPNQEIASAFVIIKAEYQGNIESHSERVPVLSNDLDFAVYFQSGNGGLVADVENNLVIKSFDKLGNPKDASGHIEQNGQTIAEFSSLHDGLASTSFVATKKGNYTVHVKGSKNNIELKADSNAVAFSITQNAEKLALSFVGNKKKIASIVISGNGKNFVNQAITNPTLFEIEYRAMPFGVYSVALLDASNNVIARQLWMNKPTKYDVELKTNKQQYNPNEGIKIDVNSHNEKAYFSMKLIDEQSLNQIKDRSHSIESWMYLGNEFECDIEEPTYYFKDEKKAGNALNLWLVANQHNWRRDFRTGEIENNGIEYYRTSARISGTIQDSYGTRLTKPVSVTIKNTSYTVKADSNGRFFFDDIIADALKKPVVLVVRQGTEKIEYEVSEAYIAVNAQFAQKIKKPETFDMKLGSVERQKGRENYEAGAEKDAISFLGARADATPIYIDGVKISGNYDYNTSESMDGAYLSVSTNSLECMVTIPNYAINYVYNWNYGYTLVSPSYNGYQQPFYINLEYNYQDNAQTLSGEVRPYKKTVFWQGELETSVSGKLEKAIYGPNKNSNYLLVCEGITESGKYFTSTKNIKVQDEVEVFSNLPTSLTKGDVAMLDYTFKNNTNEAKEVVYSYQIGAEKHTDKIFLNPNEQRVVNVELASGSTANSVYCGFSYVFDKQSRTVHNQNVLVLDKGHLRNEVISGNQTTEKKIIEVSQLVENSAEITISISSDFNDMLESTAQRMIRQPGGCFEQVSSSNYPNLLALKTLQKGGKDFNMNDLISKINDGYRRLVNYETSKKGFEWYGNAPPHESLTAYGLLQFFIMRSLNLKIDEKMFDRNLEWLKSRRNHKGGFEFHSGKYGFGSANEKINNAYITWVLSRIEKTPLYSEITAIENDINTEFDAYKLALLANIYANQSEGVKAKVAIEKLYNHFVEQGFKDLKSNGTVMYSHGTSRDVEILSLGLMAMKAMNVEMDKQVKVVSTIVSKQTGYGFGNTQATALALEVLSDYTDYFRGLEREINYYVWLDNERIMDFSPSPNKSTKKIVLTAKQLTAGTHQLWVQTARDLRATPFVCEINWIENIEKKEHAELGFDYTFSKNTAQKADVVFAQINIENKTNQTKPQTVAVVKIPGGFTYSMDELRQLKKDGVFEHFESKNDELVFYFLGLLPNEKKNIKLALRAVVAGTYSPAESYVYQYYSPEIRSTMLAKPVIISPVVEP